MNHSYAVVRCKKCSFVTTLKYLGPEDGKTAYTLLFPDPPWLVTFTVPCKNCGTDNRYTRHDVEAISIEQQTPEDIVDQIPAVQVEAVKLP